MGGSGSVVTAAGLVFAFTMMSFGISDLKVLAQVGTTIGMGLLFDTLVVRAFMTPSIAALLGRWFWWPQNVRPRPVPAPLALPPNSGNRLPQREYRPVPWLSATPVTSLMTCFDGQVLLEGVV